MYWIGNGSLKLANGVLVSKNKKIPKDFFEAMSEKRKQYFINKNLFVESLVKSIVTGEISAAKSDKKKKKGGNK